MTPTGSVLFCFLMTRAMARPPMARFPTSHPMTSPPATTSRAMASRCAPIPTEEPPAMAGRSTASVRPPAVRAARCASSRSAASPAEAVSIALRSPLPATERRAAHAWQPACARAKLAHSRSPARNNTVRSPATTASADTFGGNNFPGPTGSPGPRVHFTEMCRRCTRHSTWAPH
jgi:hypothetical protein